MLAYTCFASSVSRSQWEGGKLASVNAAPRVFLWRLHGTEIRVAWHVDPWALCGSLALQGCCWPWRRRKRESWEDDSMQMLLPFLSSSALAIPHPARYGGNPESCRYCLPAYLDSPRGDPRLQFDLTNRSLGKRVTVRTRRMRVSRDPQAALPTCLS